MSAFSIIWSLSLFCALQIKDSLCSVKIHLNAQIVSFQFQHFSERVRKSVILSVLVVLLFTFTHLSTLLMIIYQKMLLGKYFGKSLIVILTILSQY